MLLEIGALSVVYVWAKILGRNNKIINTLIIYNTQFIMYNCSNQSNETYVQFQLTLQVNKIIRTHQPTTIHCSECKSWLLRQKRWLANKELKNNGDTLCICWSNF